jgi:hypothetical protein
VKYAGLRSVQDGPDPLETLKNVETGYYQYQQSHEAIRVPEAIGELKAWLDTADLRRSLGSEAGLKSRIVLPKRGMWLAIQRLT